MKQRALIIGNSDGIGLGITKKLLDEGWKIFGISRSSSAIENNSYKHFVCEVQDEAYLEKLEVVLKDNPIDLCIYCAGIGELLDFSNMEEEIKIFEVNLLGMIKTVSKVIPVMVKNSMGHFIGISSLADEMLSDQAPSYHASKAAFSNYLEGLALALRSKSVYVTNVRFGFVDTKMAKGDVKPFMMPIAKAVEHLKKCIEKKPARYTAPRVVLPLIKLRKHMLNLKVLFG